jgi:hypothetical protein
MLEARSHKPVMLHVATALCHCLRTEGWSACCPSAAGEDNVEARKSAAVLALGLSECVLRGARAILTGQRSEVSRGICVAAVLWIQRLIAVLFSSSRFDLGHRCCDACSLERERISGCQSTCCCYCTGCPAQV